MKRFLFVLRNKLSIQVIRAKIGLRINITLNGSFMQPFQSRLSICRRSRAGHKHFADAPFRPGVSLPRRFFQPFIRLDGILIYTFAFRVAGIPPRCGDPGFSASGVP